jgi:hypothetical protein
MIIETNLLIVGAVSFLLHVVGKWQSTTCNFWDWIKSKDVEAYFITSFLLCTLALILQPELAAALGMQPLTYAAITCYGGGHFVATYLEVKQAVEIKKAEQ